MNTLLWFQRDLRLYDNPALTYAIEQGKPIIAVYLYSPQEDAPWSEGAASRWWLHHSLQSLSVQLAAHNIELQFFNANSVDKLPQLAIEHHVDTVVWTCRHEPQRRQCENDIKQQLIDHGIDVKRFKDELLQDPDNFLTASKGSAYRVFTPFYKKLRQQLSFSAPHNTAGTWQENTPIRSLRVPGSLRLSELNLLDTHDWHQKLHQHWTPGEAQAWQKLDDFIADALSGYIEQRDYPAIQGTSGLAPHLHFGEISPRQILNALTPFIAFEGGQRAVAAEAFMRQLIWREFARYILWHFPETVSQPMNDKYRQHFWKTDACQLRQWQQGKTGIAIIDAGMQELWQTGSMHNRVRMLAASVLTKNMGIAWQQGARWFWDTLVDADLANNTMGWQWVAGCGVDAAPYFRIFNPQTQAMRFDKQQHYIRRWVVQTETETKPVIDLSVTRKEALERYHNLIHLA